MQEVGQRRDRLPRAGVRANRSKTSPHPRPRVPDAVYRLHPWRRVLLPQGEGPRRCRCALFTVLLSNLFNAIMLADIAREIVPEIPAIKECGSKIDISMANRAKAIEHQNIIHLGHQ